MKKYIRLLIYFITILTKLPYLWYSIGCQIQIIKNTIYIYIYKEFCYIPPHSSRRLHYQRFHNLFYWIYHIMISRGYWYIFWFLHRCNCLLSIFGRVQYPVFYLRRGNVYQEGGLISMILIDRISIFTINLLTVRVSIDGSDSEKCDLVCSWSIFGALNISGRPR